jgi:quinol-cytochrome oxidoreductase complex cytochrome b subunit
MRLKWWETFFLIFFGGSFVFSVVLPWLSERLIYNEAAFAVIFILAVLFTAAWTTFGFSRENPKREELRDNNEVVNNSFPSSSYQRVFPVNKDARKWQTILLTIIMICILLLLFYFYKELIVSTGNKILENIQ